MRTARPLRALGLTLAVVGALAALVAAVLHFDAGVAADARAPVDEEAVEELPSADLRAVPDRKQAQLAGTARTDAPPTYEAPIPEPPAEEDEDAERRARDPVLGRLDHLMVRLEVDPDNKAGRPMADFADISVATLAMLSMGFTNRGRHAFKHWVSRALRHIRTEFKRRSHVWENKGAEDPAAWQRDLLGAFALIEAYGMTESPIFARDSANAAASLLLGQHPDGGFGPRRGDFLSTVLASKVIKNADLILHACERRDRDPPSAWRAVRGGDLLCDREYLRTSLTRASRFLAAYLGSDGLVDERRLESTWFGQDSMADLKHEDRLGPTAAVYLVAAFAGEDPRTSPHAVRAAAWMAEHLPVHWPTSQARDPHGMPCVVALLDLTAHGRALRQSLRDRGGYAPLLDIGEELVEDPGPGTTASPVREIALSVMARASLGGYGPRYYLIGR